MCSATQEGFRRRRSKEETRACLVARSATGPGKPYWKRPAGSTGDIMSLPGRVPGMGAGAEVVDVVESAVEDGIAWVFRVEYMAAVIPAPVAALAAAIKAIVDLDILTRESAVGGGQKVFIIRAMEM